MSQNETNSKRTTIVIFGASGDLTHRKLIPALYNNFSKGRLPAKTRIIGFARRDWSDEDFRHGLRDGLEQYGNGLYKPETWNSFAPMLSYFQGNLDVAEDYTRLQAHLAELENEPANRLYYLATSPNFYGSACQHLGAAGMANQADGRRNIIIEKPFGHDLASAQALDRVVHQAFEERSLPGQRNGPEHPLLALCQHHL